MKIDDQKGQSTLEFSLTLILISLVGSAVLPLFVNQWNRLRCNVQAFEYAEKALKSPSSIPETGKVKIEMTPDGVIVEAQCGKLKDKIILKNLASL